MKNFKNLAVVAAVIVAAGGVFALKPRAPAPAESAPAAETTAVALPRLLELGADKCIPCKQMAPILADLKTTFAGQLEVDFIDVWKNPDAGGEYGVRVIPLQIFFDANGKELFRHEGFYAKDDILAKWRDLGYEFP
jgi:thioredoxin 1